MNKSRKELVSFSHFSTSTTSTGMIYQTICFLITDETSLYYKLPKIPNFTSEWWVRASAAASKRYLKRLCLLSWWKQAESYRLTCETINVSSLCGCTQAAEGLDIGLPIIAQNHLLNRFTPGYPYIKLVLVDIFLRPSYKSSCPRFCNKIC